MDKPVVVADTNILVSSVFWSGNPHKIVKKGIQQEIFIFTSPQIVNELKKVLQRDFNVGEQEIDDIVDAFMHFLHIIRPKEKMEIVKDDPKDDIILECAIACHADYIISGDKHLLRLKMVRNIPIVSAHDFFSLH